MTVFQLPLRTVGLLAMLMTAACSSSLAGESKRVTEFLGERAIKVLAAPDRVEVFRVVPTREKKPNDQAFAGYPQRAAGKEQGPEYARELAGVLKDDHSYDWDFAKACEFEPGVGYRVWSGKDSVVVLICFHCNEIGVIEDESKPDHMHVRSADPARKALVKLARQALPDDKTIQSLSKE
jgi:hypothetical protein